MVARGINGNDAAASENGIKSKKKHINRSSACLTFCLNRSAPFDTGSIVNLFSIPTTIAIAPFFHVLTICSLARYRATASHQTREL